MAALVSYDSNRNAGNLLLGGLLATAIAGSFITTVGRKLFDETVWRRNKDLLLPPVF